MLETNDYESTFPAVLPPLAAKQLLLSDVLAQACIQIGKISPVEIPALVVTGIGYGRFASIRIDVLAEPLSTDTVELRLLTT